MNRIEDFIDRLNFSKADLLRGLDRDPKSSVISSYIKGRSNPSYEICCKLINLGITAQELFGDELGAELVKNSLKMQNSNMEPINYKSPEFQAMVEKALIEIEARKKK